MVDYADRLVVVSINANTATIIVVNVFIVSFSDKSCQLVILSSPPLLFFDAL